MRMKKRMIWVVLTVLAAVFGAVCCCGESAAAESDTGDGALSEWTVMLYFCGSDLESKYGYATDNLKEIKSISYPYNFLPLYDTDDILIREMMRDIGSVNVLIETGGASEWHAEEVGMNVSPDALQRWRLNYYPTDYGEDDPYIPKPNSFELLETLPLQSMGDPDALTDFIRWAAAEYPAEKYALVLWGHGEGALGLFVDELYDRDIMYLYEMEEALQDAGVPLELVVLDACLMANMETAWTLKDCARWMVASEENVPGEGTAVGMWLQSMVEHPALDGEWVGRRICDTTTMKYYNGTDERSKSVLIWSVIDLSQVGQLVNACQQLFRVVDEALRDSQIRIMIYAQCFSDTEEYGDSQQNMRDLGSLLYHDDMIHFMDNGTLEAAKAALADTVVYCTRGSSRGSASGIAFCYPADFESDELNIYAKNFPVQEYLAYLDAITEWNAPEWIYVDYTKPPNIDAVESLRVTAEKRRAADGMPSLYFGATSSNLETIFYNLYRKNEERNDLEWLGRTDCGVELSDQYEVLRRPRDPMHWPAIEGVLCSIDLVQVRGNVYLYNIPVQINSVNAMLRCGRTLYYDDDGGTAESEYVIYGVWEGYDDNSSLMNRSVEPLAITAGRAFRMLYPMAETMDDPKPFYAFSEEMKMLRQLKVEEIPLPPGTYYLEFELTDIFMRKARLEKIEVHWDGETMTFADDLDWEGEAELKWSH